MSQPFFDFSQPLLGALLRLRQLVVRGFVSRGDEAGLRLEQLAELRLTVSQLHQRRELWIESLAVFEMCERVLQLPAFLEVLSLGQLLMRRPAVLVRAGARQRRGAEHGEQSSSGCEASSRVTLKRDHAPESTLLAGSEARVVAVSGPGRGRDIVYN